MHGYADVAFEPVAETFRQQLRRTQGGAAVAVYHRGEKVVDLWGGSRTVEGDPWEADTLAMCFSTTKGVASTALHLLADRGIVDYDEPVATYWPEFAQAGKQDVTVRHVMSHSAGMHRLRSVVDGADRMLDWDHMVDALARSEAAYPPGAATGYHALTYGWLVGEIVRRVDGRPIEAFVAEELAEPLGVDGLHVGCPEDQRHRVAPLEPVGMPKVPNASLHRAQKRVGEQFGKLASAVRFPVNPRRLINALAPRGIEDVLWGSEIMDAAVPAANGFFDARSLARMYAVLAGRGTVDGTTLLTPATVAQLAEEQNNRPDRILVVPMRWRLGYHAIWTRRGVIGSAFGHFGFGGSGGWADPERDLAMAFVCNRGTGTPIGDLRLVQLSGAVMDAVRGLRGVGAPTAALA